jgi:aspartate/glutamate racemase
MKTSLYQKSFAKYNIQVLDVSEEVQQQIQISIFAFKYDGLTPENIRLMVAAAEYLKTKGAQALIMGARRFP